MTTSAGIVIAGAGHAGATTAMLLRRGGYDEAVVLIGDEDLPPYERPHLTKRIMQDDVHTPSFPAGLFEEQHVELMLGRALTRIDADSRTVLLDNGASVPYDALVLATGARPRRLPVDGLEGRGAHSIRTLADARAVEAALPATQSLCVVGGGWLGLELAAAARQWGTDVTVLERETTILPRVASPALARIVHDLHLHNGVRIQTGVGLSCVVRRSDGSLVGVELDDGVLVEAQLLVMAVGAQPNDEVARSAGILCEDGIVVDSQGRTSTPHVFAVGDVTARPVPRSDRRLRLESIPSATEQAKGVVAAILDRPAPEPEVPWFWSDQFGSKIRIAGLRGTSDRAVVQAGALPGAHLVLHVDGSRLTCVETVDSNKDFMTARRAIREGHGVDLTHTADGSDLSNLVVPGRVQAAAAP